MKTTKNKLWRKADGSEELPIYGREVIVLSNHHTGSLRVSFGHRPVYLDAVTYGEGKWNIPDVVYWLDAELPDDIENFNK